MSFPLEIIIFRQEEHQSLNLFILQNVKDRIYEHQYVIKQYTSGFFHMVLPIFLLLLQSCTPKPRKMCIVLCIVLSHIDQEVSNVYYQLPCIVLCIYTKTNV
jgi:hypothetical protein